MDDNGPVHFAVGPGACAGLKPGLTSHPRAAEPERSAAASAERLFPVANSAGSELAVMPGGRRRQISR